MKKKFKIPLTKPVQPNLNSLIQQAGDEFSGYAREIFDGIETEKKPDFDIQDLYSENQTTTESTPDNDDFNQIVEQARLEALAMAATMAIG